MTSTGKASDQSLTEEAYALGNTAGRQPIPEPRKIPSSWEHLGYLVCREVGLNRWSDDPTLWTRLHKKAYEDYPKMVDDYNIALERRITFMEGFLAWRKKQRRLNASGENQHQLGPREFTFTYSPSWGWDDEEAQNRMKSALEKLTRYYKNEIIEFHAVGEFGHDGRSHVHAWYHLAGGRKITDKNFRRAYERWNPKRKLGKGFEGGHHATIERISDFAGYTEKHLDEAWFTLNITNAHEGSREAGGVLEGEYGTDDDQEEGSSSGGSTSGAEDEGRD